jgi:predicted ATPase
LGISIQAAKGFAAKEAEAAYVRAEKLCDQSGETAKLFTILLGLFHCHFVAGEIKISRKQAERCYAIASQEADPALRLAAHHALCGSDYFMGQFDAACDHLDHALHLEEQVPAGSLPGLVDGVFVRAYGCHAVWHLGDASGAVRLIDNGIRHARSVADPFSIALALDYSAMLHQFNGNHHIAGEQALEAMELCSQHHFSYYLAWATIIHGWVLATEGQIDDGLAQMQSGLADLEATGAGLRRPYYLGLIADAHAQAGRPEQGLSIVDQAIAVAESMGERWRDADLQRIKGKLLLAHSSALESDAEACFLSALQIARNQKTKPLELRAATSLAYLWQSQGKRQDAHDLLFPVYDWFTEGFDTADLKDAKALLEELK